MAVETNAASKSQIVEENGSCLSNKCSNSAFINTKQSVNSPNRKALKKEKISKPEKENVKMQKKDKISKQKKEKVSIPMKEKIKTKKRKVFSVRSEKNVDSKEVSEKSNSAENRDNIQKRKKSISQTSIENNQEIRHSCTKGIGKAVSDYTELSSQTCASSSSFFQDAGAFTLMVDPKKREDFLEKGHPIADFSINEKNEEAKDLHTKDKPKLTVQVPVVRKVKRCQGGSHPRRTKVCKSSKRVSVMRNWRHTKPASTVYIDENAQHYGDGPSNLREEISMDTIPASSTGYRHSTNSNSPLGIYPINTGSTDKYQGVVVVIIINVFKNVDGTQENVPDGGQAEQITELFQAHRYLCIPVPNTSKAAIFNILSTVASKGFDQLICFISSHGDLQGFLDTERQDIYLKDVYAAIDTKQMMNKPKCLFISTCRKDTRNKGACEPPNAHFIIGHACLPNQLSVIDEGGSRYFNTIIRIFKESMSKNVRNRSHCYIRDVNHMMTKVNRDVEKEVKRLLNQMREIYGKEYVDNLGVVNQTPIYKTTCQSNVIFH